MIHNYLLHLLILIGIWGILAMSLNLAMGFTGLMNVGHAAFFGIGAYTSALLALKLGAPFWLALICAGVVAAIFGFLLGIPTLRLKGDYLALGTLGFGIVVESVLKNWTSLTRGPVGLPGIPKAGLFGFVFKDIFSYFIFVLIITAIVFLILNKITKAPFGLVLKATREDEVAAQTLGKNIVSYKLQSFTISAFFAGIAGSLYAHYITFINPSSFTILEAVLIISMVIVGGFGSIWGSFIGAAVLILLPEPLRFVGFSSSTVGAVRQILYSVILVLLIVKRPQGLFGEYTLRSLKKEDKVN